MIIYNDDEYIKYKIGADFINENKCLDCFYFPLCCGGCPEKRIKNFYYGTDFDCCVIQKNNLEEILDYHYEHKLKNEKK